MFHMKSWMLNAPLLDFFSAVNGCPVPQQDHRPLKMLEQVLEGRSDIQAGEVPGAKLDIKGQASSFGGHGQRTDRRNSVLLVEMVKDGRLPLGCPGAGDGQSPALWFLTTPTHPQKQTPDMVGVILDAKVLLDQPGPVFRYSFELLLDSMMQGTPAG